MTHVLNCGHPPTVTSSESSNGITHTPGDYTLCYDCATADEVAALAWEREAFGYLDAAHPAPGDVVTTWPGGVLGRLTGHHESRAARRRYVRMRDAHGQAWYGTGPLDCGTYVRLHKATRG